MRLPVKEMSGHKSRADKKDRTVTYASTEMMLECIVDGWTNNTRFECKMLVHCSGFGISIVCLRLLVSVGTYDCLLDTGKLHYTCGPGRRYYLR